MECKLIKLRKEIERKQFRNVNKITKHTGKKRQHRNQLWLRKREREREGEMENIE